MNNPEYVKVYVGGTLKEWPKEEYLDIKARQLGFEDYEDLKSQGFSL